MADQKISDMAAAGPLTGAELLEAVQGGANVQTTAEEVAGLAAPRLTPGYISGRSYPLAAPAVTAAAGTQAADVLYAIPAYLAEPVTITTIGGHNATAASGVDAKFAIYSNVSGAPGLLLAQGSGSVSCNVTNVGVPQTLTSAVTLAAGWYWFAALTNGAANLNVAAQAVSHCYVGATTFAPIPASRPNGVTGVATFAGGFPGSFGTATLAAGNMPYGWFTAA